MEKSETALKSLTAITFHFKSYDSKKSTTKSFQNNLNVADQLTGISSGSGKLSKEETKEYGFFTIKNITRGTNNISNKKTYVERLKLFFDSTWKSCFNSS